MSDDDSHLISEPSSTFDVSVNSVNFAIGGIAMLVFGFISPVFKKLTTAKLNKVV
jgi:uncharacterized membrane protein